MFTEQLPHSSLKETVVTKTGSAVGFMGLAFQASNT